MNSRFEYLYKGIICPDLARRQNIKNVYRVPSIETVVLHIHSKHILKDLKEVRAVYNALAFIVGVEPKLVFAKKSVSQFNVRRGSVVGCKLCLHGRKLFPFLDYLNSIFFDGFDVEKMSLDLSYESSRAQGNGTFSLGVKNLVKFSHIELHAFSLKALKGLNIAFSFKHSLGLSLVPFLSRSSLFPINLNNK